MVIFFFFFSLSLFPILLMPWKLQKKSQNKERGGKKICFVFPLPATRWLGRWPGGGGGVERKPEVYSTWGSTSSTATDVLILSPDTWSVSSSATTASNQCYGSNVWAALPACCAQIALVMCLKCKLRGKSEQYALTAPATIPIYSLQQKVTFSVSAVFWHSSVQTP